MTWCTDCSEDAVATVRKTSPAPPTTDSTVANNESPIHNRVKACPSCGHQIKWQEKVYYITACPLNLFLIYQWPEIPFYYVYIYSYISINGCAVYFIVRDVGWDS